MLFWVTVPILSFPLWEDEVMEKIGKALGKFIGFTEVRKLASSSIKLVVHVFLLNRRRCHLSYFYKPNKLN